MKTIGETLIRICKPYSGGRYMPNIWLDIWHEISRRKVLLLYNYPAKFIGCRGKVKPYTYGLGSRDFGEAHSYFRLDDRRIVEINHNLEPYPNDGLQVREIWVLTDKKYKERLEDMRDLEKRIRER